MASQQAEQENKQIPAKNAHIPSSDYTVKVIVEEDKVIVSIKSKSTKKLYKSSFTWDQLLFCGFNESQTKNLENIQRFIEQAQAGKDGLKLGFYIKNDEQQLKNGNPNELYESDAVQGINDTAGAALNCIEYGQVVISKEDNYFGDVKYQMKLKEILRNRAEINTDCIVDLTDDLKLIQEQLSSLTTDLSEAKSLANEEGKALQAALIDLQTKDKVSMDHQIKALKEEVAYLRRHTMPKGSVIKWYGNVMNIPDGFEVYCDDEEEEKKDELDDDVSTKVQSVYKYESDFDVNGIIYAIGTEYGEHQWQNPSEKGLIEIKTATMMGRLSKPKDYLIGRESGIDCIVGVKDSDNWFSIDFKTVSIKPSNYTLRHITGPNNKNHLRNWVLEGSNDGNNWECLSEHKDDESLNENDATFTWKMEHNNIDTFYQYFRLRMTGPDSSGQWYLCCSGFEIYGQIKRSDDKVPKSIMNLIKIV